ncbi:MAG: PhoH family protein [Mariprofundus sp.]|nr:PhoH family protein [Mariprofundus sp.]
MNIALRLERLNPTSLRNLCGANNWVLNRVEQFFNVRFLGQPGDWNIEGKRASAARQAMHRLLQQSSQHAGELRDVDVEGVLRDDAAGHVDAEDRADGSGNNSDKTIANHDVLVAGRRRISGKTPNQRMYLKAMQEKTLTLAVGPAGSGKTYLAVAAAIAAMNSNQVERIILTRPAVEAGERLGFLPGDLQQKIDPYLRPLYDAMSDMLGVEKMNTLLEQSRIEVAPLAYMRGRTLNDAFVILDEAQNTTREQMKMFLTRLGFGARMVVTGDVTQIDLPRHQQSGLLHALHVLDQVGDIAICRLSSKDVVRHQLVEQIVNAYEEREAGSKHD